MDELKIPRHVAQLYMSDDLVSKLKQIMPMRGYTSVSKYLRYLIDEDCTAAKSNLDDDSTQKHTEVQTPVETDLDSVII